MCLYLKQLNSIFIQYTYGENDEILRFEYTE